MGENARRAALQFDRRVAVQAYFDLFTRVSRRGAGRMIKRLFDALVSGAGLLVSAPLWMLIPAAIKLEDGGPVFFPQARVGRGGQRVPGAEVPLYGAGRGTLRRARSRRASTIRELRESAAGCARRRWTNCRSCGTSSSAT